MTCEGDARDFVVAADAGEIVEPTDAQGSANAIERTLEHGPVPSREPSPAVARFERRALTEQRARAGGRAWGLSGRFGRSRAYKSPNRTD